MKLKNTLLADTMEWQPCLYFDSMEELESLQNIISFFMGEHADPHPRDATFCYDVGNQIKSFLKSVSFDG